MKRFRGLDRKDAIAPAEPNKTPSGIGEAFEPLPIDKIVGSLSESPAEQAEKALDEACKAVVDREDLIRRTVLTAEEGQAKETS